MKTMKGKKKTKESIKSGFAYQSTLSINNRKASKFCF